MNRVLIIAGLLAVASSCFGETTVEVIQKRAEEGDAAAQTLLGLMYYHGYNFTQDYVEAEKWFEKGVEGGDAFAGERLRLTQRRLESKSNRTRPMLSSRSSMAEIQKLVASAEFIGNVEIKDYLLERDKYDGKVFRIRFRYAHFHSTGSSARLWVHSDNCSTGDAVSIRIPSGDKEGIEWAMDADDKESGRIFVFSDNKELYAVGARKSKSKKSAEKYKW